MADERTDHENAGTGPDGLPLEPVKRRAAVAAQFDDLTAQLAALDAEAGDDMADGRTDDQADRHDTALALEAKYLAAVEAVQRDLGAVLRHHAPMTGWPLCVHALVETAGTLAVLLIKDRPDAAPVLLQRLDELRLLIGTTGQRGH